MARRLSDDKAEGRKGETQYILADRERITPAYCKPMRKGYSDIVYEDPRIDFENRVPMTEEQETGILREIGKLADKVDVIAVCDQFRYGMISERVRKELERLACRGKKIVVDSRSRIGLFRNVVIKPNEMEASAAVGNGNASRGKSRSTVEENIELLYRQNQAPVIVTMEEDGALWYDGKEFSFAAGIPVEPPVDIVGAGDAFLAAFSCAYGAGIPGPEAIAFGNLVSSIVIKKIGMTGTAAPDEILDQMIRYGKERTL